MKYQSREFCKDTNCPIQHLLDNAEDEMDTDFAKTFCHNDCSAYDFHKWLDDNNYSIVKDFDYDLLYLRMWLEQLKYDLSAFVYDNAVVDIGLNHTVEKIEEYLQDLEGDDGKTIRELRNEG